MGAKTGSLTDYKKTGARDPELQKVQQNVENAIAPIIRKEIVDGVLLKNVCLEPGVVNSIKHRLGRSPQGWIVVRKRADSRVWDVQDFNTSPKNTLTLTCSHTVEIDLWIF